MQELPIQHFPSGKNKTLAFQNPKAEQNLHQHQQNLYFKIRNKPQIGKEEKKRKTTRTKLVEATVYPTAIFKAIDALKNKKQWTFKTLFQTYTTTMS